MLCPTCHAVHWQIHLLNDPAAGPCSVASRCTFSVYVIMMRAGQQSRATAQQAFVLLCAGAVEHNSLQDCHQQVDGDRAGAQPAS